MSDKLIKIASYNTPVEANFAQNILAEEGGIESCLDNEATVGLVGYFNVAVGGVKLFVYDFDAERAREILARGLPKQAGDISENESAAPGGRCPKCNAKLEPGFETCWSCGEPLDEHALESLQGDTASASTRPAEKKHRIKPETSRMAAIEEADDLAKKAWFASILGFIICPFLLHCYSAALVCFIFVNRFTLSRRGSRYLLLAMIMDLLVFAFLAWMAWWKYS